MPFPERILLATDGSTSATLAGRRVAQLAASTGAEVHVLHVALVSTWTTPAPLGPAQRERILAEAHTVLAAAVLELEEAGVDVASGTVRTGRATEQILLRRGELEADLVVIGHRGQNALTRALLGNDAEQVVRHAPCAVLVVRDEEGRR
ncbi:universal stress protein [Serinicoccus sp. LYQ131]|uniref:universal stress protein n=1 Tax=Serinicoccus sp. LYQ131 TaxID=3378797 RepID=UPI003852FC99